MTDLFKNIDWRKQIFPRRENLTDDLTTIDFLKAAALILMIIDHVGWLLLPDFEILRTVGRLSAPLWFFLIGYARTREIPMRWFIAVFILFLSSVLVGLQPIPLSILMVMALTRVIIDPFWRWAKNYQVYFWWMILLLIFFAYPTDMFLEYGTMGFLIALAGYAVRNRADIIQDFGNRFPEMLMIVALGAYGTLEAMIFGMSAINVMILAAGLIGTYFILIDFESKTLPGTAGDVQAPLVRFMGRYTLEIYVIHLLILKAVFGLQMIARWVL